MTEPMGATFEWAAAASDALVIRLPFDSEQERVDAFWAPLTTTSKPAQPVGWILFKRRTVFNSMVLFEAIGLRSACSGAPGPEPVLQVSIPLLQGGT